MQIANDSNLKDWNGKFINNLGLLYLNLSQYPKALDYFQQSLKIAREIRDHKGEASSLNNMGLISRRQGQYQQALDYFQQSLVIMREINDHYGIATNLSNLGNVYQHLSQYPKALDYFQQSLKIAREISGSKGEANILNNMGIVYRRQGHYPQALDYFQQSLMIARKTDDRIMEMSSLSNMGLVYLNISQYSQAINNFRKSLKISREIGDRYGEASILMNLGLIYRRQSQYSRALDHFKQSLVIAREIGNVNGEASNLNNLGLVYQNLSQYQYALDQYQQSLDVMRKLGNPNGVAMSLSNIGNIYENLGQYPQALDYHQQSLAIAREIGDLNGQAGSLNNLGNIYGRLSQYPESLNYYQQSLAIVREIGDRSGEATSLNNLGNLYKNLNQYSQASDHYQKSLEIAREINDYNGQAQVLGNLGNVFRDLHQYSQAKQFYQQSLAIARETGDRNVEANSLSSLGLIYLTLGQSSKALNYHQQSIDIQREIGDRYGEAVSLNSLGLVFEELGEYQQAMYAFRQALNIMVQINVPDGLWRVWFGMAELSYRLNEIHAAILAGKQAVNILQSMRASNISLEKNLQISYIEDKFEAYHALAEMLIEQGRLAEAEQVMAMLKEEEYFDFIQRDGNDDMRMTQAGYTPIEKGVVKQIDQFSTQLVLLGKEYENLTKLSQIDEQAKIRLVEVEKELERAQDSFINLLSSLEGYFKQIGGGKAVEFGKRQLEELESQQDLLHKHEAVIITTVVTKDKLHLILTTPEVQLARESAITESGLNDLIKRFRNALKHPGSNPVPLAQELYNHLVKPLEKDLQKTQAKTLMWSLDGALRYVPLATLHDGQQFLIEKYGLSLYTSAAQNNLHENNVGAWRAAGLGVSLAHPGFVELPSVPNELRNIIRQNDNDQIGVLPGVIYLDQAFNRESFKSVIRAGYPVLHIASHFKLQPGDGSLSTLLLGDGDLLSLDEFRRQPAFRLHGVDLLTLSACDTAVGDKGTGGEVESFAVMAQLRGANGVLASLWRVEDESTGLLMKRLYRLRSENTQLSKAEALRQAQIAMLNGDLQARESGHDFRHPYFWAPFVMMGNWL